MSLYVVLLRAKKLCFPRARENRDSREKLTRDAERGEWMCYRDEDR